MFEVVDYTEEKTLEKLQHFVNSVIHTSSLAVGVPVVALKTTVSLK